jgi:hypothetical protein
MATTNIILDLVLIAAAIWMVATVRGVGGVVGRTLNLITIGAVVLGLAHFLATWQHELLPITSPPGAEAFIHRVIVLLGFVLLVAGFRQIRELGR